MHETWHTTLFGTYYGVEMVRIQNNSHLLEITCYVAILWVFKFFGTFAHKVVQTWFVLDETWHTTLFGIYYCVEAKFVVICKKLRVTLRFLWVLKLIWHFRA